MGEWIDVNDRLPEKDGEYLVIIGSYSKYRKIASYAHDLFEVDDYDFNSGDTGWFDYDGEVGYYKVRNVLAWTELPEIPEKYLEE